MLNNFICASLIAAQLASGILSPLPASNRQNASDDYSYVIHAAGEIENILSTNSREALRKAYDDGNRYVEIDFNFTSDQIPVCIHDWNKNIFPDYKEDGPNTFDAFMQSKVYGKFTPMSLNDVINFMTLHTDLYIISDVKDYNIIFCQILNRDYPEFMDRFIIQVYSEDEYKIISEMGFENMIFTLYTLDWQTKTNPEYFISFAKSNKLWGYTFPADLCNIPGYVEKMKKTGVPLFVHTVNDKIEQQKYFNMGIDGIYTDNTTHK